MSNASKSPKTIILRLGEAALLKGGQTVCYRRFGFDGEQELVCM